MKAAVIYAPGDVRVVEIEKPTPKEGEVLIRVKSCGVCGTEHTLFTGGYYANYPVVLGHEYAGEIVEIGNGVKNFTIGDHVTVDPNIVCHKCDYCHMGSVHLCENLRTLGIHINGGDAEYSVVPETNVFKIPSNLTFEQGSFCEPLACVIRGFEVGQVKLGDTVLVLGGGSIGNLIMQCALYSGAAHVIVSEPLAYRRQIALENGATDVIDPTTQDVAVEIKKFNRIGADIVFECVGKPSVQSSAVSLVRKGGTVVLFGVSPRGKTIEISPFDINENEIKITGSFNNPNTQAQALRLLASQVIRVDNLITNRLALEDYPEALKMFGQPNTIKTMVIMEN